MKVLVIGSGAREHALVWKLAQSERVKELYALPGNGGICQSARCLPGDPLDFKSVVSHIEQHTIDLTVIGPEAPLVAGLADVLRAQGKRVFGPTKKAALLEGDKAWAKGFCAKYGIPSARYAVADAFTEALALAKDFSYPLVIKASGLAAGKGVIICHDAREVKMALQQMMIEKSFGEAAHRVVLEEYLTGPELTIMAFCDGTTLIPLVPTQDHKKLGTGETGPNTGGMGAYGWPGIVDADLWERIQREIFKPFLEGLSHAGIPYCGIIYFGLMLTAEGPKLLEFNVRFGDPECQVALPLLQSDLVDLMEATISGTLNGYVPHIQRLSAGGACCVVLASGGYPGSFEKHKRITGLADAARVPFSAVFHAGTTSEQGEIFSAGGRVLGVTAWDSDIRVSIDRAYEAARCISFEKMYFRTDIGWRLREKRARQST